jgi:diacylglycerol kinase (ATP)
MEPQSGNRRQKRVKLIFNPHAGANNQSPVKLMDVIQEMQAWKFVPEPFLVEPDCDLAAIVKDGIAQGILLFVVCGGDGTISAVAKALIGTRATMGIIPTGTQNNIALSLGISSDIPTAIANLRNGRRIKTDCGIVTCNAVSTPFFELCSVGLFSAIYPSADDIHHGNVARVGDFLTSLITTPQSQIHLLLDDGQEVQRTGHVVLIANMPYVIRHFQVAPLDAYANGMLDVLLFADLSKLNLIGYMLKGPGTNTMDDPQIEHFRARKITVSAQPDMHIIADGVALGTGQVQIKVQRHALAVMAGLLPPKDLPEQGGLLEQ